MKDGRQVIGRFAPGQDGRGFRREAFEEYAAKYGSYISGAISILQQMQFELPRVGVSHAEQMRPELLFRHSIPFCVTEETFFQARDISSSYLAALLAGHTLALTNLDYHLDGVGPADNASATAKKIDLVSGTTYALRMVYAAGRLLSETGNADRIFRDVFDPISGFVILRMYEDWAERYSEDLLAHPEERLTEYLHSPTSRILASGYWELMVKGSFASHGVAAPPELISVLRSLRKLRQIVDEIADLDEDIRTGLITLPILYALRQDGARGQVGEAIRVLWRHQRNEPDAPDGDLIAHVRKLVEEAGGFEASHEEADSVWRDACKDCAESLGDRGSDYLVLLDIKRAKLEFLSKNGWRDQVTEPSFMK
jgi:hypothetical protein